MKKKLIFFSVVLSVLNNVAMNNKMEPISKQSCHTLSRSSFAPTSNQNPVYFEEETLLDQQQVSNDYQNWNFQPVYHPYYQSYCQNCVAYSSYIQQEQEKKKRLVQDFDQVVEGLSGLYDENFYLESELEKSKNENQKLIQSEALWKQVCKQQAEQIAVIVAASLRQKTAHKVTKTSEPQVVQYCSPKVNCHCCITGDNYRECCSQGCIGPNSCHDCSPLALFSLFGSWLGTNVAMGPVSLASNDDNNKKKEDVAPVVEEPSPQPIVKL